MKKLIRVEIHEEDKTITMIHLEAIKQEKLEQFLLKLSQQDKGEK